MVMVMQFRFLDCNGNLINYICNVMTPNPEFVCWWWPSWMEIWVIGYNFESWPFKDHSCHVCFKLAYWFQREKKLP